MDHEQVVIQNLGSHPSRGSVHPSGLALACVSCRPAACECHLLVQVGAAWASDPAGQAARLEPGTQLLLAVGWPRLSGQGCCRWALSYSVQVRPPPTMVDSGAADMGRACGPEALPDGNTRSGLL
ncbi:hypothetical protein TREES_T100010409 [Tupaia chinensis]|uniref:Uncharacterized protein n=1 Tax=Tupaia chinensis TaxID=246437 RepID=L9LB07_TUPCH|nr:hypothetical protein TREES_T100010409 [Tupaia chinensis]